VIGDEEMLNHNNSFVFFFITNECYLNSPAFTHNSSRRAKTAFPMS
jgi:hypothetical protein